MKPIENWNTVEKFTDIEKLPAGAYIIKILAVADKPNQVSKRTGNVFHTLELSFDIAEGDFADYYKDLYKSAPGENKKWKGVMSLFVPDGNGTEQDMLTAKRFKTAMCAIEDSNTGYTWDWNEQGLIGKKTACIFRNEEWSWEGKTGMTAKPFKLISITDHATGKYTIPADKLLAGSNSTSKPMAGGYAELGADEDLPF